LWGFFLAAFVVGSLFGPPTAFGGVPPLLNFQGRIVIGGVSFNGTGQFQFALVDNTGTNTFWSNDGTSTGGGEPAAAVSLILTNGLYAIVLGDTNVSGMSQPIDPDTFTNGDVRLRVWFNDNTHGFEQLSPDQRIVSAGYSLVAQTANNLSGLISSAQLPGNLATTNFVLAQGFVTGTVTNGLVTAAITNGLATTNYADALTNGLVTAAITNALATTNFVLAQGFVTGTVTNGLVTAAITNGLATTGYVDAETNGFVTAAITNGLATTNYANGLTNGLATTAFVLSQSFVTAAITNGLATTNYANGLTNGLATTAFVLSQSFVTAAITNALATTNYANALTNSLATTNFVRAATNGFVTAAITNALATTNYANALTNSLATTNFVRAATNGFVTAAITNGLATTNFVLAQGYTPVKTIWSGTSGGTVIALNATVFFPPNNSSSTATLIDGAGDGTRVPVTETMTLTNLYLVISAAPGSSHTNTLTIMTNGVASPLTVMIFNTGITATNNTTVGVTIPAGTEIGVKITTQIGATAANWEWSFEGR
jgi:uncharacterized protein YwbE